MATTTTNLGLKKPAYSDFADVSDLNDNMDKIDAKFGNIGSTGSFLNTVYPIGSIYMSVASTNPGTLFGGTWVQLENRFLLGAGTSYTAGQTGGSATKTLTEANMPSHNHSMAHTHTVPTHTHGARGGANLGFATFDNSKPVPTDAPTGVGFQGNGTYYAGWSITTAEGGGGNTGPSSAQNTGNNGSGTAFNSMPPYLAVYMWKRTA